jgi:hypothetical protein
MHGHLEEKPGTTREKHINRHHYTHAAPGTRIAMAVGYTAANCLIAQGKASIDAKYFT